MKIGLMTSAIILSFFSCQLEDNPQGPPAETFFGTWETPAGTSTDEEDGPTVRLFLSEKEALWEWDVDNSLTGCRTRTWFQGEWAVLKEEIPGDSDATVLFGGLKFKWKKGKREITGCNDRDQNKTRFNLSTDDLDDSENYFSNKDYTRYEYYTDSMLIYLYPVKRVKSCQGCAWPF